MRLVGGETLSVTQMSNDPERLTEFLMEHYPRTLILKQIGFDTLVCVAVGYAYADKLEIGR